MFPLATPSIASPGAMMAVVLLTQNDIHTINEEIVTTVLMLLVIGGRLSLDAVCESDHTRDRRWRGEYRQPRDGDDPGVGGGDAGA